MSTFFWPFFHIWMNGSFSWNFSNLLKITEMIYFSKILPKSHHIGSYNFIWMISYNVCVNPQLWPCCIWFWRQIDLTSDLFTVISMYLFVWIHLDAERSTYMTTIPHRLSTTIPRWTEEQKTEFASSDSKCDYSYPTCVCVCLSVCECVCVCLCVYVRWRTPLSTRPRRDW